MGLLKVDVVVESVELMGLMRSMFCIVSGGRPYGSYMPLRRLSTGHHRRWDVLTSGVISQQCRIRVAFTMQYHAGSIKSPQTAAIGILCFELRHPSHPIISVFSVTMVILQ
jgi:hypothetical protein